MPINLEPVIIQDIDRRSETRILSIGTNLDRIRFGLGTSLIENEKDNLEIYGSPINFNPTENLLSHLQQIEFLEDNWDGYGAILPTANIFFYMKKFLVETPPVLLKSLEEDDIYPTPHGTLIINWESNNDIVSLEIGEEYSGFYCEFSDGFQDEDENILSVSVAKNVKLINAIKKISQL